ncbi:glycosyltransferase family 4 protein [Mycolicibacterium gilvum]
MQTRGGISTYVRDVRETTLWRDWNIRHVATHRDGSAVQKATSFAVGFALFLGELVRARPDVIHLHSSADTSFLRKSVLAWVGFIARIPVVFHIHSSDFPGYYQNAGPRMQAFIRRTLARADTVVALGDTLVDRLRSISPRARVIAIPNAVRPRRPVRLAPVQGPVHVVFLGRIGDRKGTFRLLDAWHLMQARPEFAETEGGPRAVLTIAGDGDVAGARNAIAELGLAETVTLCEWLSPEEVAGLLDRAHVLVLPSHNEGQPMAVLEAMARGLCVIASDAGGLKEMLDEDAGLVVDPDDVPAIADAVARAVLDDDVRVRYGAAAHARLTAHFDIDVVAQRVDDLYRDICADPGRAALVRRT